MVETFNNYDVNDNDNNNLDDLIEAGENDEEILAEYF